MSAPPLPPDEHLTLLPGRVDRDSTRGSEPGREGRQRREFQPGRQQIEIRVAGGRRAGCGALRGQLGGDGVRVGTTSQANGKESGRIGKPLAHELLETKPQLRLVGARQQVGNTAPLLAQSGEISDQLFERGRVRVEEQLTPDRPERRRSLGRSLLRLIKARLTGLLEALSDGALLQPAARVRHAGGPRHRSEGTDTDRVPEQLLGVSTGPEAQGTVEEIGTLSADPERRALETRRGAGRAGAQRVTTEQRREFVGGRERVRSLALRGVGERGGRLLGGGEGREAQRSRHGVNRPVPIDEIRAARGRGGEDRV